MFTELPAFKELADNLVIYTPVELDMGQITDRLIHASDSPEIRTLYATVGVLDAIAKNEVFKVPYVTFPEKPTNLANTQYADFAINKAVDIAWSDSVDEETRYLARQILAQYFIYTDEIGRSEQMVTDSTLVRLVTTLFIQKGSQLEFKKQLFSAALTTAFAVEREAQLAGENRVRVDEYSQEMLEEDAVIYAKLRESFADILSYSKPPHFFQGRLRDIIDKAMVDPNTAASEPVSNNADIDTGARDVLLRKYPERTWDEIFSHIHPDSERFVALGEARVRIDTLKECIRKLNGITRRTAFAYAALRNQLVKAEEHLAALLAELEDF